MREILKRMSLSIILVLSFCICVNISVRAESSTDSIKQMLSPYDEWFDYVDEEGGVYYKCPNKDVGFEEMFNYVQDFHFLLQGIDYADIGIKFEYSTNNWISYDDFSRDARGFIYALKHCYGEKCVFSFLDGTIGRDINDDKYTLFIYFNCYSFDYVRDHEDTWFGNGDDENDNISGFYDKANYIVQMGRNQTSNNMEFAVFLCKWVKENVNYSENGNYKYHSADALLKEDAVCDGQSSLIYDLFTLAGIPVVKNMTYDSSLNHAWNSVYINNVWYTVDVNNVVDSISEQYADENEIFFVDPNHEPDNADKCKYVQQCMITPQAFINTAKDISIKEHETYNLRPHVRNLSASATVTYSSSDLNIAVVDSSGTITPNNKGSAIITVNVLDRGNDYTFNQVVNVSRNGKKTISKLKIKAKKNSKKIEVSTLKGSDISISANRKIFRKGKKKTNVNNCKSKSVVKLSGKLKKGDKITVNVSKDGYKTVSKKIKIK